MNIRFTHTVLQSALFGVVLMLSACVNSLELATPNGRNRSQDREQAIREAVAYFDNHRALLTRSAEAESSEEVPFVAGDIVVDWESAVTVANEEKRYTDFTMRKDNRFYLLLEQEGEQMEAVELYSRFASVEDFGLDTMNQYVATYIPDVDYLQTYRNVAHEEGINCEEWYEFSGVVMYTMLSGHYVAAYRYDGGALTERAFLYDREQTDEENIADFCSVMEGLTLGVAVEQGGTRTDIDPMLFGGWGDDIIETAYTKDYSDHFYKAPIPEDYEVVEPEWEKREGTGGGGGGPAEEEEEEDEPTGEEMLEDLFDTKNLSDEEKKIVGEMLEEIYDDCMGRGLIVSLVSKNNKISLNFSYNDRAGFNPTKGIQLNNDHSEALFHEMFHAYQYSQLGPSSFNSAVANMEVEAYLATYFYMTRCVNDEVQQRSRKKHMLGSRSSILHKYLNNKGEPIYGADLTKFMTIFINEANAIKQEFDSREQNIIDNKTMSIDPSATFNNSIELLQSISEECKPNKNE